MDKLITHYVLTFGSSSIILVLGFLLLGIRIPETENFKKLHTARKYLSFSYFILAVFGFISYFMHIEAENNPVLTASTLFVASYQALLFTTTSLVFIQTLSLKKFLVLPSLCIITIVGIPLLLSSIYSPNSLFSFILYPALALYLFQLLYYIRLFRREYGKCLKQLEIYYDEEENDRMRWVKFCFYSALGVGILALFSLFSSTFLYDVFVVIYTAYYTYMVYRFYNYIADMGFLMPAISSAGTPFVEEKESGLNLTEEEKENLTEKEQQLKSALDKWVEEKRYCRGDNGVDDIALMLGTTRPFLRYYFRCRMSADFRAWRTELRVAEAKRMINGNPGISLEEVCKMTGFNHRANFHRQFQKITGQTPAEYKAFCHSKPHSHLIFQTEQPK
jgi:AraC-like DNA-binding protein